MIHYFMKQTIPAVSIVGLLAAFGLTCFLLQSLRTGFPRTEEGNLPMTESFRRESQGGRALFLFWCLWARLSFLPQ